MKVRVLIATLAISLLVSVQGFANPCNSACVDPCAACDRGVVRTGDLFSGLKRLVNGVRVNSCDPCDAVVACNPCDDVCTLPQVGLGGRLRGLFASQSCTPCDFTTNCDPCGIVVDCDPCGFTNNGCVTDCGPRFSLRSLNPFRGLSLRGCNTDCDPCCAVTDCDPCSIVGNGNCGPCDIIGNGNCDPCGNICDTYCGPRGHLLDLPRISLKRLFGGLRPFGCNDGGLCNPCDSVCPRPCDDACCR